MLYRDMSPDQRAKAFNGLAEARVSIEGCRDPSPKAVRYTIEQQRICFNVARKLGDAWAIRFKNFNDAV